jgi:hypothetical protein
MPYVGADLALTWCDDATCIVALLPLDVSYILEEPTWVYVHNMKFHRPLHFLFLAATVIFQAGDTKCIVEHDVDECTVTTFSSLTIRSNFIYGTPVLQAWWKVDTSYLLYSLCSRTEIQSCFYGCPNICIKYVSNQFSSIRLNNEFPVTVHIKGFLFVDILKFFSCHYSVKRRKK